jgi:hypothetical protein
MERRATFWTQLLDVPACAHGQRQEACVKVLCSLRGFDSFSSSQTQQSVYTLPYGGVIPAGNILFIPYDCTDNRKIILSKDAVEGE